MDTPTLSLLIVSLCLVAQAIYIVALAHDLRIIKRNLRIMDRNYRAILTYTHAHIDRGENSPIEGQNGRDPHYPEVLPGLKVDQPEDD